MNWRLFKAAFLTMAIGLAGCSDGGGGDNNGDDGGNDDGQQQDDDGSGNTSTAQVQFNLAGAVSLVANQNAVSQTSEGGSTSNLFSRLGGSPAAKFSYRINDGSLAANETDNTASNLLAIDADGNASLAIDTNMPIKVMYSVSSPDGEKVYIALDTGWWDYDGSDTNDYSQIIADLNCGLLEVQVGSGEFTCVGEGLFVQQMDDQYHQNVSGNQKPIQFDKDGNVYFTATTFTVNCDPQDADGNCVEGSHKWIDYADWNPRIYTYSTESVLTPVSQDNESVQFFLALSTGEVAYQAWQDNAGSFGNVLKIISNTGAVVNLSNNAWVKFFTTDSENAVIWGEEDWSNSDGLKMAKPNPNGNGFQFASLDTSLFGSQDFSSGGWNSPTPLRVIMADDGRVYGVFESGTSSYDDVNDTWEWNNYLKVYQMLPFDGVPKVELSLGTDGWWTWMQDTPFQISRGFLYYTEEVQVPGFGAADVIRMVNLATREPTTLLDPMQSASGTRYQMYNWRLSGNTLFFSALDLDTNTVVTGKIDTLSVRDGDAESTFLEIQQTASASGAASKVQDIEVIAPTAPPVEAGTPLVETVHVDPVNIYSMSVDFNKYMDPETVESNVVITSSDTSEGDGGTIPAFKLWMYKTVHLIPDLEQPSTGADPLLLPETVPMDFSKTYTLSFNSGIRDLSGFDLSATGDSTLDTRPDQGWYSTTLLSTTDSSIASGNVLKYATDFNVYEKKTWELNSDIPDDFMVEFSAKNFAWEGVDIMVQDMDQPTTDDWNNLFLNFRLGSWNYVQWANSDGDGSTYYGKNSDEKDTNQTLFNGIWKRYRIKVYDDNVELWYSSESDGTSFEMLTDLSKTDLVARRPGTVYRLLLRAANPVALDNLEVSSLNTDGTLNASIKAYADASVPTELQSVVSDSKDPDNIW